MVISLLLLLSAFTVDASEPSGFKLFVGGGIAHSGPNFYVSLDRVGRLRVRRTGLPMLSTGKLTESTTSIKIKSSDAKNLIALAEASEDFSVGCEAPSVPDGTSARLSLTTRGGPVERECVSARSWPNGLKTTEFLKKLNARIPRKFRVY